MKEYFRDTNFRGKSKVFLAQIIGIVIKYQRQGYRLTLRQLYYQLVASGVIPNKPNEYAKLSDILTNARMAGLVDWDAIEDRVRVPRIPSEWENVSGLVQSACDSYRLARWSDQDYYVELWTEKDAIAGILRPIAHKYHVTLCVNRGYSSASAMYDASKRFIEHEDKKCVLLYLGDHDPSGLDMDRDIKDRLAEFGADIEYIRIGLTWEQIQALNPPPNPAKFSDPRSTGYIDKYGEQSWEVDAIPPETLNQLVTEAIEELIDMDKYNDWIVLEDNDKQALIRAAKNIDKRR